MAGGRDENLGPWPRTEEFVRDQLAEYYGLVTHLDEQVGRIVKTLDGSRFAANTILIYAADHGLAIGSHGLLGKQSVTRAKHPEAETRQARPRKSNSQSTC